MGIAARSRPAAVNRKAGLRLMGLASSLRLLPEITFDWLLAQIPVQRLFGELRALVFQQLCIAFDAAVQRHADFPRSGEDIRVFDGGFVHQRVRASRRETLDYM